MGWESRGKGNSYMPSRRALMPRSCAAGHDGGMSNYRRVYVPGGTYFFTVNLLERRRMAS